MKFEEALPWRHVPSYMIRTVSLDGMSWTNTRCSFDRFVAGVPPESVDLLNRRTDQAWAPPPGPLRGNDFINTALPAFHEIQQTLTAEAPAVDPEQDRPAAVVAPQRTQRATALPEESQPGPASELQRRRWDRGPRYTVPVRGREQQQEQFHDAIEGEDV